MIQLKNNDMREHMAGSYKTDGKQNWTTRLADAAGRISGRDTATSASTVGRQATDGCSRRGKGLRGVEIAKDKWVYTGIASGGAGWCYRLTAGRMMAEAWSGSFERGWRCRIRLVSVLRHEWRPGACRVARSGVQDAT